ncbi:arylsulfatase [uncultured Thiohalocapsa sp.]|uniref:arylsulfatase n=1 Tax=uncultured Thiohalocapsa sp. TaxID=768990 RepID=UPI0025D984A6|nr:arylsulfatase [uncultured Thiohalocapsa sp.]
MEAKITSTSVSTMACSALVCLGMALSSGPASAQEVLPFPDPPMGGAVGPTMQESVHQWRQAPRRLPEDAPNLLIVMLDDAGFGQPDTFGGEIHTPTLTRLAEEGIAFNRFHTTAMCSPTRAALMTGRNHHRVGAGQIAEFANDWDGYTGVIPKSSATIAEVLGHYGYATSAFGKDHNTPVDQIANGPYDRTPTGRGFDYFYGFIAGETSQWEPTLWENTTPISMPHVENYEDFHLTEAMADKAITWMRRHLAINPDRPFLMWWTPGAVHGPHHVARKWADKYKGKFDDGWDAYQERVFQRQKATGWIPEHAERAPRPEGIDAWEDIPDDEKTFQARLMEVYAGFFEHTDAQVGRLIDELEARGIRDNTLILYLVSDNGASAEGLQGSVAELNSQNGIPSTVAEHIAVAEEFGGLDAIGGPRMDNMYHAGWAWAGDSPFRYTKLVAADWGGTRTPLVVSWPARIEPDATPRPQFTHVNDVVPTIYEILGITPPKVVNGHKQDPIDGVSFAYTFASADAPERKTTQYFEVMGSRGIYHEGWMASTFGPRTPWDADLSGLIGWEPSSDIWQLFDTRSDYSLMNDLAEKHPHKLQALKALFMEVAAENKVLPVGGGLYTGLNPQEMKRSTNTEWTLFEGITRIPESEAPNVRNGNLRAEIEAEVPEDVNGVIFAMGGYAGGVSLFAVDGTLYYEYSALLLRRDTIEVGPLPAGEVSIALEMRTPMERAAPAELKFWINGQPANGGTVRRTVPAVFTASETFDVGMDTSSPVANAYFDKAPFAFEGRLARLHFETLAPQAAIPVVPDD